ncbi:growth arrest-specific protein 2-like isoform X1 [Mytilus californianus]|uniref:growth arrest-specific protein 2-like isoform X1 n=2 Tax=Mytilus californianus TaxID=6549 RepID=UPI0022456EB7|nr:growth arrest-specific protein 2-like isoform X1 [Mytilus californianus]
MRNYNEYNNYNKGRRPKTAPFKAGNYDVIDSPMTKVVERDCGLIPMMNGHGKEAGLVPLSKEESQKEDEMTKRLHVLQEESLEPLKEDLSEWLAKTLNIDITAETFMDVLDNGVCLCKLAQVIQQKAEECVANGTCTESIPRKGPRCKNNAPSGSWFARDNAANFLSWCNSHGMKQESMFETEYLVSQTDQKSVINCLLEVARLGYKFGLEPPNIIKMETEIEEEEEEEIPVSKPVEIVRPLSNKGPNLDAEIQRIAFNCKCHQYIKKLGDGKYAIFGKVVHIRFLQNRHIMVRIGGGWDTLENYLEHHIPKQVFEHRRDIHGEPKNDANKYLYFKSQYRSTSVS